MSLEITHVRYENSSKTHEAISRYRWRNEQDGGINDSDKRSMVDWVDNKGGKAYVGSGSNRVQVGVVNPVSGQPYLRTYADDTWNNNLLSLPEF